LANIKLADAKMEAYDFPDGTGSVGLPEGWKINVPTCIHGVPIQGPADQRVMIGKNFKVYLTTTVRPSAGWIHRAGYSSAMAKRLAIDAGVCFRNNAGLQGRHPQGVR
jgi:hypothetical protein